jgi:glycosyltransferase involved in cell wall biosynthesis
MWRQHPGKRQEDAVRAVSLLTQRGLDVQLTLLGGAIPDYGIFLRELVETLGLEKRVEFVAFTPEPFAHVASADLALMCSRAEAFGRVTVEAMKCGTPVVGANSAGTAELIQDGRTGFLYRPGDVGDLAAKVETLYRDRDLLETMGRNAGEWSRETFSLGKYTSSLLSVFAEVTGSVRTLREVGDRSELHSPVGV